MTLANPQNQYIPAMEGRTAIGESIAAMPVLDENTADRSGFQVVKDFYTNYWSAIGNVFLGKADAAIAYGKAAVTGSAQPQVEYKSATDPANDTGGDKQDMPLSPGLVLVFAALLGWIWLKRR